MRDRHTISEYKIQAKEQMLGNYGIAIRAFVLIFVLIYFVSALLLGAYESFGSMNRVVDVAKGATAVRTVGKYFSSNALYTAVLFALDVFAALFMTGYLYVLRQISDSKVPVADIFFAFRNHPDTVIIIALVISVLQWVVMLPGNIVGYLAIDTDAFSFNGKMFFAQIVLSVAGLLVFLILYLSFAMAYLVYIDDPNVTAFEALKKSSKMMKGNKFRYFYMYLTMIGYFVLVILSVGIGYLWVNAYINMIIINMYKDIKEIEE